jgi:hypothetical protein
MNKRLIQLILLLAILLFTGCASGEAWYYPYGPPYSEEAATPTTVSGFLSQPAW